MSRASRQRLDDILVACETIAKKDLDPVLIAGEDEIPWSEIARMRDVLAHRYFDTAHSIVFTTARTDIPVFEAVARRLLAGLDD